MIFVGHFSSSSASNLPTEPASHRQATPPTRQVDSKEEDHAEGMRRCEEKKRRRSGREKEEDRRRRGGGEQKKRRKRRTNNRTGESGVKEARRRRRIAGVCRQESAHQLIWRRSGVSSPLPSSRFPLPLLPFSFIHYFQHFNIVFHIDLF